MPGNYYPNSKNFVKNGSYNDDSFQIRDYECYSYYSSSRGTIQRETDFDLAKTPIIKV